MSFAQINFDWSSIPSYNSASRHHPITFSNDRYGFVIAGQTGSYEYLKDVHRYDAITNTWQQLADFPGGPRGFGYGVAKNNKAYLGFGKNDDFYPNDWWEYDMENDSWTQLADFPYGSGRLHPAMVLVNQSVYVGLGSDLYGNLGDWWEYKIDQNQWVQRADFLFGDRHHPFYFGIGDFPYVGFGHGNTIGNGFNIYNDFYKYDPSSDQWIQLNDFPSEGRVAGTQFSFNGKGYVLSGDGDDHSSLDSGELWEYNPELDSWQQLPSHPGNARWAPGCFVIGCDLYFTSGHDRNPPLTYYNDMVKVQLSQDCGCLDPDAFNYNFLSITDNNSCCYVAGCTDQTALNYNPEACYDDGSCIATNVGCSNPFALNYDSLSNSLVGYGGPADIYEYGIGSYHFNDELDMMFDCYQDVVINSVDVYAQTDFTIQLEIVDDNDNQLFSNDYLLSTGLNTLQLDYPVSQGQNYKIGINGDNQGLFRNNFLDTTIFPIQVLDAIAITGNSIENPQIYNYFYNWKLSTTCDSLVIPKSWNCVNDACIDPMDGSGVYSSIQDCEKSCEQITFIDENNLSVDIFPNPSSGLFNVNLNILDNLEIIVTNQIGQIIVNDIIDGKKDKFFQIDLSNYSKGLYNLTIKSSSFTSNHKMILQ